MDKEYVIKSLNMIGEAVLTLEKAKDRIEFEALPMIALGCNNVYCPKETCGASVIVVPPGCQGKIPEVPPPTCASGYHPQPTPPTPPSPVPGGGDGGD
ncbi:MAG: hypothetical protein WCK75_09875 [Elusimicrobiota bacterium]